MIDAEMTPLLTAVVTVGFLNATIVIVGAVLYPVLPDDAIVIPVTEPALMVAVAVAVFGIPEITTSGGYTYPEPPFVIVAVMTPLALTNAVAVAVLNT